MLDSTQALDALTPRELEVARLVANGRSVQQAADELGIAFETAAEYFAKAASKLPGPGRPLVKVARCWHLFQASA